ncbi:F-box protein [Aspergillus novofumigatus IBT 16806]|uniref:F-box domain-containing protein n=1 Tax=Aspergillus novofumigatus (strain IBT 16806) TaxID=1392255 RepID=A0A2I1BZ04_ASPN1|nr:uncharacterized protein P174DRAFT_375738 [Aspergillus novofumigatus IBT 16806]PKX90607.1 hypothetical protein P174DRAFT_375738 [Aspergillus novofumigatus IBT 16806]
MAASLPFELLCEIAGYLQRAGTSLVACTTVCRRWQAAFESFTYSKLNLYREDGYSGRRVCLNQFREFTSGPRIARRAWIRQLWYDIVLPFELPDWTTRQEEGYTTDNPVRQANDTAFQSQVIDLFNTLGSWDKSHRLSVILRLRGRELGQEPCTEEDYEAGRYNSNTVDFGTQPVPVYRARFDDDGASMLRDVSCIDQISFPNLIWAGAAMQIVRHCPELTELYLHLDEYIRPDHQEYLKKRRQAVAEGLKDVSPTLRVFHFENADERNWKDAMPPLNVLSSSVDTLSIRIRELSLSLHELTLLQVPISLDFLWPLDAKDHPLPANAPLHWPNLETLNLYQFQPWLPSGEWIVRPDAGEEAMIAGIEVWEAEIRSYEKRCVQRPIFEQEQFHRLFISLGYAARRMPRLKALNFDLNHYFYLIFTFSSRAGLTSVEWELERHGSYMPDDRVAAAWGFQLDHEQLHGRDYHATLPLWPPLEGKSM